MLFAHDTEVALIGAANLVNTAARGRELLPDPAALSAFLADEGWTGRHTGSAHEHAAVCRLRPVLRRFWEVDSDEAVAVGNQLLRDGRALPQLVRHDDWDWHLHATGPDAPLATRMAVEAAMAVVDVVRQGELDRLRICAASDCDAVLVDLSRNRSKRYCDVANCGNRANVAAYRARRAASRPQVSTRRA